MAKAKKTVEEKPEELKTEESKDAKNGGLRDLAPTDFTYFDKPLMAYVRLNSMCVVGLYLDIDNASIDGVVWDELNNTQYSFSAAIE